MRKIIIITLLLISALASAQKHTASFTFSPTDLAGGVRYDLRVDDIGFYLNTSYGSYNDIDVEIKGHMKYGAGWVMYNGNNFVSLGMSHHTYKEIIRDKPQLSQPFSFEIGTGMNLGRVRVGVRIDVPRWEPVADIGINF